LGTDASQIQQAGLGNVKPQLMYQDIPVFRNDFVSRYEFVNTDTKTLDKGASGAATLKLGAAEAVTGGAYHARMRGSDGVMYRWEVSAGQGSDTLTVSSTGTYLDPEQNKQVSRKAPNDAVFTDGQDVELAERADGSSLYVGCWGEFKGIVGFTSSNNAGLKLEYVGPREDENAYQYRMKW